MKDLLTSDYFWKSIYALAFIIIVLFVSSGLMKFLQTRSSSSVRKVLECYPGLALDTKRQLLIVRWHQKEYLLLLSPSGEQVIDSRPLEGEGAILSTPQKRERTPPIFSQPFELTEKHAIS